uniref:1-phosphatidylinositol 4-kinase n=2 Tax=Brassica TaxID=3705 RepID=M4EWV3_BRACM
MSPANATEIEIAGGEEGDKFEVGKIYDVKLTTGIEFKGIVLAYDPDPHLVIFHILSDVKIITVVSLSLRLRLVENIVGDSFRTIPETGDSMNTRMVNENFISTLTYIGKCKDPLASKERWIDLSGLEEKEAIAIREIESIGVGVTAEAQKVFNDLSKTKIESIGVGVAAEAPKSFDAFSKTYPIEQDLVVEILPVPVMRARDIIVAANMALKKKIFAQKISRATNGAYFLMDEKMRKVAVFKPEEEEDGCSRKGEKANREVAAYLLDFPKDSEEDGFGGVPPTTMVRCMDFKGDREKRWAKGSLQQFIPNKKWYVHGERSDAIFSIQDFQKMTLLDIRYGNTDRNQDNILNKEGKLIPIDHGECFPTEFDRYRLDWTVWEMAEIPYLTEMVEYVKTLDVDKDLEILRTNGIELGGRAVFVFRVQHMVLKLGVLGGNVPKDIGHLLTHPLSGGTSESLGTLFHKCMTRNPTDVTLLMDSLHDSIKGVLQWAREERVLRREIKSIGVGVTAEAQKIFNDLSKTLPVQWVNKDILVSGKVRIRSPYHDDCVTGGTATARNQIKAVLKKVRQELQLGTGGN